jgi:Uncharacterised protein family (UPF0137)
MSNVNALIAQRLKKGEQTSKMAEMAKQSVNGNLSGFSGIFAVTELNPHEKQRLEAILIEYAQDAKNLSQDLETLISITSEVKAINNQAAILHGERIKKAHTILIHYREGAFTSWLMAAYGNRQTPYNFLQYYQFYELMPRLLRTKLETMPRQAIYTLASREGPLNLKQKIVEDYSGQSKMELMETIRETFPLAKEDKRAADFGKTLMQGLERIHELLKRRKNSLTKSQIHGITKLIDEIKQQIHNGS